MNDEQAILLQRQAQREQDNIRTLAQAIPQSFSEMQAERVREALNELHVKWSAEIKIGIQDAGVRITTNLAGWHLSYDRYRGDGLTFEQALIALVASFLERTTP